MFCKKRFGKIHKIGNNAIVPVCPKRSKFKTIARLFLFLGLSARAIFNVVKSRGIRVIFRIRSVGNHENLHVFVKSAGSPKTVALIAVDLIERLFNGNTTPL